MEDTYLSLLVEDILYVMLLQESPEELVQLRLACPLLHRKSEEVIFRRDYLRQWKGTGLLVLALCQAQDLLSQHLQNQDCSLTDVYVEIYYSEDYSLADWVLSTFGYQSIDDLCELTEEMVKDFITRLVQFGHHPSELALPESEWVVDLIRALYPEADYTDYHLLSMKEREIDEIVHLFQTRPHQRMQALIHLVRTGQAKILQALIQDDFYTPWELYQATGEVSCHPTLPILLTPAVLRIAIREQKVELIESILQGKIAGNLGPLYQPENFAFLHLLLERAHQQKNRRVISLILTNLHLQPIDYPPLHQLIDQLQLGS